MLKYNDKIFKIQKRILYMDYKKDIALALSSITGIDAGELEEYIEIPPNSEMGDFAFPCFKLARTLRKAPPAIAAELKEKITLPDYFSDVQVAGGYLNFFADKSSFAKKTIEAVFNQGEKYGSSDEGQGRNVCIDYSSINIAKPFHIGHLSSTVIGHSLYRIFNHLGYNSVGINHLGDWGTQFGKLIVAYKKWGDRETIEKQSVKGLLEIYVKFHDEAEKDESLNDEARFWFKKIEEGDKEALELFAWFKELTLREVKKVYDMLDITFDSYAGESFYNDKMGAVIDELKEKNLLKEDKGAMIVDLEEYNMPPCLILRSDGATLYATRDLAAAMYRKKTYDFYKNLYVVAYQQDLHFKQIFKVIELMGYDWYKDMVHVSFGMVSLPDGTLSTRKGKVLFLEDVLKSAVEKTLEIMQEKNPDLEKKELVAKQVGVGAVVWNSLYNGRIKDITFSWDKALNFEGETGPYAQYTHARCCSVIRKAESEGISVSLDDIDYSVFEDEESRAVIKALEAFPKAVKEASVKYEPYLISRNIIDICKAYNKFYFEHRIMGEQENVMKARIALTMAVKTVIKTGLYLVGLEAPEKM